MSIETYSEPDIRRSRAIVQVIATQDSRPQAEFDLAMSDSKAYYKRAEQHGVFYDSDELPSLLDVAVNALEWHGYASGIDHSSAPEELVGALNPLFCRHGIRDFDWSFIQQLEQAKNWEALKNDKLLPLVAAKISARGLALVFINPGSGDSYTFTVVTPEQYQQLLKLAGSGFSVSDEHLPW